jgi:hypothetical protein
MKSLTHSEVCPSQTLLLIFQYCRLCDTIADDVRYLARRRGESVAVCIIGARIERGERLVIPSNTLDSITSR